MGVSINFDLKKQLLEWIMKALKDLGEAVLGEIPVIVREFLEQRKTPDGWTKEEWAIFLIGRLTLLQKKEIGNTYTDRAIDYLIDLLIDELEEGIPVDVPPPAPVGFPYGEILEGPPDRSKLVAGDLIYQHKENSNLYMVLKAPIGVNLAAFKLIAIVGQD